MAAPVLPPRLRDGDRLTREEFLSRWEGMPDLKFAELIDGIVYMASPVWNTHCDYHFRLRYCLGMFILGPGTGGVSRKTAHHNQIWRWRPIPSLEGILVSRAITRRRSRS